MHVSMSEAWDDAQAFVRREFALLLPVGLATLGIALLVWELVVPDTSGGAVKPGAWMWAALPIFLLDVLGWIAISALVLRARLSVGEALRLGLARLPIAALMILMLMGAGAALLLALSVVIGIAGAAIGWSIAQSSMLTVLLLMPVLAWASVRLLPSWALLADRGDRTGALALIKDCFALTRGTFWRLLGVMILLVLANLVLASAIQFAFGSILLLLGRAIGSPQLGELLTAVLMAMVGTLIQMVWIVYVACIYRRLTASSGT